MLKTITMQYGFKGKSVMYVLSRLTQQQFDAIYRISKQEDFAFTCMEPKFFIGGERGAESFLYYTKDGALHLRRIGVRGTTIRHLRYGEDGRNQNL